MSLKKILAAEGIYPNPIDHGYERPRSGGTDVMQELVQDLRHEQGLGRTASSEFLRLKVDLKGYGIESGEMIVEVAIKVPDRPKLVAAFHEVPEDGYEWSLAAPDHIRSRYGIEALGLLRFLLPLLQPLIAQEAGASRGKTGSPSA